ncbi:3-keto-L-gulonate-6-phosphate decarboxylase [Streptococcus pneumoniae]|nr:3-keto-L-gulonate-6-phosphate decarboxylase [Streptococcus pneumoniae]
MTKRIPNLQVALDHSDLQGAIKAAVSVGQEVDIIEAGTVCLLQVGSELAEVLRSLFPDKIIVADTKCADAGETWGEKDLNKVKKLIDMGFRVSVTGGLDVDTLKLFEGVDVFTFIAGRGITEAADPAGAARAFKDEIKRIWG